MGKIVMMGKKQIDGIFLFLKAFNISYTMKKQKNKNVAKGFLTKEQKREARNFWRAYKKTDLMYHSFYTQKTGKFDARYIPDNIYYNNINMYMNAHSIAKVIDNKCYYDILFPGIPQPETIACRKGGLWFVGQNMISEQDMLDILETRREVFVKTAVESAGGSGVRCVSIDKDGSYRNEVKNITDKISTDIVIQGALEQHAELAKLNSNSVNTMRILTLLRNGEVKVYSSVLRIGGSKGRVDNFSSGGVAVGIDENGKLKKYGYNESGQSCEKHPVSGEAFEGFDLPAFEAAKEMVKKAHWYVPHFKMISWDVATAKDGQPVLIEANLTNGELDFHQLCNGPLFGDDTNEILDEVFCKK